MGARSQRTATRQGITLRDRRITTVILITIVMLAVTGFSPALATGGGDDLESVRATVKGTFDYKIGLLEGLKADTDNADRTAVYQGGINELTGLRDTRVATETSIDELWALKDRAHAIYHETVDAAEDVGVTPEEELARAKEAALGKIEAKVRMLEEWIAGCDDPNARAIVADGIAQLRALLPSVESATTPDAAYALKDEAHRIYARTIDAAEGFKGDDEAREEPEKEKSEAEKAADALEAARRDTLTVITRKTALLRSAAEAAAIPAVVFIYRDAADELDALAVKAKGAGTVAALKELKAAAIATYEGAETEAKGIREGTDPRTPENTLNAYLEQLALYVTVTTDNAAPTADEAPETFDTLVRAEEAVLAAIDAVREVTDTGSRLGDRWDALNDALRTYRSALIRHYIALGEPLVISGLQIPG
jgi:hypothetical protein